MKSRTFLSMVLALLVAFPVAALAAKDSSNLRVFNHVNLANTTLAPGHYKVEWSGSGSHVQVKFLRDNKQVAQVPARLVDKPSPYDNPAMVTMPGKDGHRRVTEIDFSKVALIFQAARTTAP